MTTLVFVTVCNLFTIFIWSSNFRLHWERKIRVSLITKMMLLACVLMGTYSQAIALIQVR